MSGDIIISGGGGDVIIPSGSGGDLSVVFDGGDGSISVEIDYNAPPGPEGPPGPASPPTWEFYAANWSTPPTQVSTTAAGAVYLYILSGVIRYRLVPTVYDPTDDAFYSTFTGGVLSGLIVSRG